MLSLDALLTLLHHKKYVHGKSLVLVEYLSI